MVRVLALVEGPTERNFGQLVLAEHLGTRGVAFHPRVIGKPGHKGGVGDWQRARREIVGLVRQEPGAVITTMFDYYALPNSWPGKQTAVERGLRGDAAISFIERAIDTEIRANITDLTNLIRLRPYLAKHEFEALLFASPVVLSNVIGDPPLEQHFASIVEQCGGCEEINERPNCAPSKRILAVAPRYQKPVDGIMAARTIGLGQMREACPRFGSWLEWLEKLGETP